MSLLFELFLSSPNGGKWGWNTRHVLLRPNKDSIVVCGGKGVRFQYNFDDGWTACIDVRHITGKEAPKYRRLARKNHFCGYDWMVDSIMEFGEILDSVQRNERRGNAKREPWELQSQK